ncbi:DUF2271 domain-containing protein [Novosphingobium umbonatum]|uniref:DUF2271 domain-containing protein n=1 Tax=Novosphingobium umbonatum TaxID=1908524 RepID=A0A437MX56_9SPHN|nr:DUF2271 domain-containing protein [Novosphingobium umbonatum]RVU02252.1 DUF2271 domain-containing protein [Novosphingobium umbonatum]
MIKKFSRRLRAACFGVTWAGSATCAMAGNVTVSLDLPRIDAANYQRPFVAVWIEDHQGHWVKNLAVFHDQTRIGARWLPELRHWWRAVGMNMAMPADGVSRPTQPAGHHSLNLSGLPVGQYSLVTEVAREKAGRDLVRLPFTVQPGKPFKASTKGTAELSQVTLSVQP